MTSSKIILAMVALNFFIPAAQGATNLTCRLERNSYVSKDRVNFDFLAQSELKSQNFQIDEGTEFKVFEKHGSLIYEISVQPNGYLFTSLRIYGERQESRASGYLPIGNPITVSVSQILPAGLLEFILSCKSHAQ